VYVSWKGNYTKSFSLREFPHILENSRDDETQEEEEEDFQLG
jgi:hypothetical protein